MERRETLIQAQGIKKITIFFPSWRTHFLSLGTRNIIDFHKKMWNVRMISALVWNVFVMHFIEDISLHNERSQVEINLSAEKSHIEQSNQTASIVNKWDNGHLRPTLTNYTLITSNDIQRIFFRKCEIFFGDWLFLSRFLYDICRVWVIWVEPVAAGCVWQFWLHAHVPQWSVDRRRVPDVTQERHQDKTKTRQRTQGCRSFCTHRNISVLT